MNEDEAILFLLDLGTGTTRKNCSDIIVARVERVQEACNIVEEREDELHEQLHDSDSVSVTKTRYGLR